MDVFEAIRGRRSFRRFSPEPVPEADLTRILEAAIWAPSACNAQLWRFIVLDRDTLPSRLAGCGRAILAMDPAVCVFVLYDRRYNLEHSANAQSAAAAIQNMLLAAHALGLAGLWMCGYGDERRIKERLGVPEQYEIMAAVLLGHPAESHSTPARRPLSEVVCRGGFNWQGEAAGIPRHWHPAAWTWPQVQSFINCSIRAKSPSPTFNRPYLKAEFEAELALIPELPGKTLFFGPYAGNYLFELARRGRLGGDVEAVVYAPEIARFLEDKARDMGLRLNPAFHVFDGRTLPLPDASVDNVFCAHQLERFTRPEPVMAEFKRVLAPGGRLVLLFSNAASPYYLLWRLQRLYRDMGPGLRGPFRPLTPWRIRRLTRGLRPVASEALMLVPFSRWEGWRTTGPLKVACKSWVTVWERP